MHILPDRQQMFLLRYFGFDKLMDYAFLLVVISWIDAGFSTCMPKLLILPGGGEFKRDCAEVAGSSDLARIGSSGVPQKQMGGCERSRARIGSENVPEVAGSHEK